MMTTTRLLPPDERRRRNHDEVAQHILLAAREVMRERGVADLNLQLVAQRVGMRAPSLYNYFPNRTAIYDALFTEGMRAYRERQSQVWAQPGDLWERTARLMESHLGFAIEEPEMFQLLFDRPVPGFVPSAQGLEAAARLMESAQRMTGEALATGEIAPTVPAEVLTNLLMALMHGIAASHLANEPALPSGAGRFGSLIPVVVELLKRSWSPAEAQGRLDLQKE